MWRTKAEEFGTARIAGAALLVICASGLLSNDLIVAGDAVATAHNIVANESRFRSGVFGELLMLNAAREFGVLRLRLETNRTLTEARALYQGEGFREVAPFNSERYAHHWFEKVF